MTIEEKTFFVETIFGHNTRQPLIRISYGKPGFTREIAMISPEDATSVALNLLNASQASLTDAFLISFLEEHLKLERNQTLQILSEFRDWRMGREIKP